MDYKVRTPVHKGQTQDAKHTHLSGVLHHNRNRSITWPATSLAILILLLAVGATAAVHALHDKPDRSAPLTTLSGSTDRKSANRQIHQPSVQSKLSTQSQSTATDETTSNYSSTTVSVNGQPVSVPANGSFQQTTQSDGSTTSVTGTSSHNSSGSDNSSSLNVSVSSQSKSGG